MEARQVNSQALHDSTNDKEAHGLQSPQSQESQESQQKPPEKQQQQQQQRDEEKPHTRARGDGPPPLTDSNESYPEGGLEAWLVVVGSWFAMLSSMGLMNTVGIFQAYTLQYQLRHHGAGTVGWVFSIYGFLAYFCGVYIGPVFDKYGPRWLVIAGCASTVTGLVCVSFCEELWQFFLSFGVAGVGTALLYTPCIAAVGHWFQRRRGFATGLVLTAGGIGGIIFPLILADLFDRVGYAWATRVLALVCLICGLVGILVRSRLLPAQNSTAHPDFRILRDVPFAFTTIAIFLLEFSLTIPLMVISTYAIHCGFSKAFAFHLLPIINSGSVVGRALLAYYADIFGPFNMYYFSVLLSLVACLCVWLPLGHTRTGIIVFSVLFGLGSGTSVAVAPICVGRICKTQNYGRYYATTYTVASFACLIAVPISGNIVQASGGFYKGLTNISNWSRLLRLRYIYANGKGLAVSNRMETLIRVYIL